MFNKAKLLLLISIFNLPLLASIEDKTKVKGLKFQSTTNEGLVSIQLNDDLRRTPELTIKDNVIQVAIRDGIVWPKINKTVTMNSKFDTKVTAYQFDKDKVRFRAILPYSLKGHEGKVGLFIKNKKINVVFPRLKSKNTPKVVVGRKPAIVKADPSQYDESYLQKLLKDKENIPEVKVERTVFQKKTIPSNIDPMKREEKTDKVSVSLAGSQKESKPSFSMLTYAGKAVGFLALVLLFFYGIVSLMKKGVLKKGKLGFLNSTKAVEVLNTTFVGPKRSLMLIKAHNQVFLVANTEKGMDFLSEINDVTGLIKDGEKTIAGDNFDTKIADAKVDSREFKLKEVLDLSAEEETIAPVKKQAKFSDQIKNKVKGLKALQ